MQMRCLPDLFITNRIQNLTKSLTKSGRDQKMLSLVRSSERPKSGKTSLGRWEACLGFTTKVFSSLCETSCKAKGNGILGLPQSYDRRARSRSHMTAPRARSRGPRMLPKRGRTVMTISVDIPMDISMDISMDRWIYPWIYPWIYSWIYPLIY